MAKSKGLGDSIEKVLKATGIDKVAKAMLGDDCGCEERKKALNKIYPYALMMTEDEIEIYKEIIELSSKRNMISSNQQNKLLLIYNRVFNANKKASSCTSCIRSTLNKLKQVYDNSCNL